MMRIKVSIAAAILLAAAVPVRAAAAENPVATVRELYASAAYEDALTLVDQLVSGDKSADERQAIALYRVLCLIALGRTDDADRAIDTLVVQEPQFRPVGEDVPPRVRTAFLDARRRLLPGLVQQQYQHAKSAFDRGDFAAATYGFEQVMTLLGDPDLAAAAGAPPLSDMRTLATGFHQLSVKAGAPAPPPPPAVAKVIAPPAPPRRDYRRTYSAADADVVPPAAVRQSFPPFPGKITAAVTGAVEVTIDATGSVESAVLRTAVHPLYDRHILSAAKKWEYEPATVDGVPVKFLKVVQVALTPSGDR